jgi:hypothetical protein
LSIQREHITTITSGLLARTLFGRLDQIALSPSSRMHYTICGM